MNFFGVEISNEQFDAAMEMARFRVSSSMRLTLKHGLTAAAVWKALGFEHLADAEEGGVAAPPVGKL